MTKIDAHVQSRTQTHTHLEPQKRSLFSAAYLQCYLSHYGICIVDKMSYPKASADTLCRVISTQCGSTFQLMDQGCFTEEKRCFLLLQTLTNGQTDYTFPRLPHPAYSNNLISVLKGKCNRLKKYQNFYVKKTILKS